MSVAGAATAKGAAASISDSNVYERQVKPFLAKHCVRCHGPEQQKGNLRMDTLVPDFINNPAAGHWAEVRDKLNLGEMPPDKEPRPTADELAAVTRWIAAEQRHVRHLAHSTGGRVLLRRLSRTEYANTIRDLLDVDFVPGEGPEDLLPPDGRIEGFDKLSKALLLDPSLMDHYFRVAELVARRAIVPRPPPVPSRVLRYDFEDTRTDGPLRHLAESRATTFNDVGMILFSGGARTFAKLLHPYSGSEVPVRGEYLIRVRAGAGRGERDQPLYMNISRGPEKIATVEVDAPLSAPRIYEFRRNLDDKVNGEFQILLENGTKIFDTLTEAHHLNIDIQKLGRERDFAGAGLLKARGHAEGLYDSYQRGRPNLAALNLDRLPKLLLDYIEIEGPLQGPWPPPSMRRIFFDGWDGARTDAAYAREIFERLLPRAYRRPVAPGEVQAITDLVAAEMRHGEPFVEAVRAGVIAMLCSPEFLYLLEPLPAPANAELRPLSGFEFAARLSYFLWNSMPDEELFAVARSGSLGETTVLESQIDRMLADRRAEALVTGFAGQWLKVHEFANFKPDAQIYRDYYDNELIGLDESMDREPLEFFREVLRRDENVLAFLDSDWLMLNDKLALFYGLEGVKGPEFRRVRLPSRAGWLADLKRRAAPQPVLGPWQQLGPFQAESFEAAEATAFPPEQRVDLAATYPGPRNETLRWVPRTDLPDGHPYFPFSHARSAFYLYRTITAPAAGELTLSFGVNDSLKVWLNGDLVLTSLSRPRVKPDDERVRVRLRAGENHLLLKVVNASGQAGFYFRAHTIPEDVLQVLNTAGATPDAAQQRLLDAFYLRTVPASRRGGVLGMAGMHKWGSDGNRTKPVHRGKYVLEVLFNDPPAPPPPNAGEVQANPRGQNLSVRDRLAAHRERESCRNCHAGLDPYGLALENFNAIGQWRERQDGEKPVEHWYGAPAIAAAGTLPNGRAFANFIEYKAALADQQDRFLKSLATKLFIYALGRTVEPTDAATMDQLVADLKAGGGTLRALIKAIARTEAFRTK